MSGLDRSGNDVIRKRTKRQVCDAYLQKMLARPDITHLEPEFKDQLRRHFDLLPTRYALDINLDTLDVLNHMQLLEEARSDPSAVFFHVRIVEVNVTSGGQGEDSGGVLSMDTESEHQVRLVLWQSQARVKGRVSQAAHHRIVIFIGSHGTVYAREI